MTLLLSPTPSFAGHQTFALRSGWLKKGMDVLQTPPDGGSVFARDEALVVLGVGKNMVTSIRHWLVATGMAEEAPPPRGREIRPTPLGQALLGSLQDPGWDPFLEDDATLWLLHWKLAGPRGHAASWMWAFNLLREYEFTRETLAQAIHQWAASHVPRTPSLETVHRDVECLIHTYVGSSPDPASEESLDSPLTGLGLIRPSFSRYFRFEIGPKSRLPPLIFAYALVQFWEALHPGAMTLSVRDVVYGEGSPGVVLKLDEDSVLAYLDTLDSLTGGALRLEDTALARQVVRRPDAEVEDLDLLRRHYDG